MIEANISAVKGKISEICSKIGRNPVEITLVAVTKTVAIEKIREALNSGIRDIGESRVQEVLAKQVEFPQGVRKHFIGHLQTNKAKKAVEWADVIQSVDSARLLEEINAQAQALNKVQDCLLEIKVSDEESKFGLSGDGLTEILNRLEKLSNIKISGLMCMAPYFDEPERARPFFKKAKEIFESIRNSGRIKDFNILSMGMSGDFEVALEEGSNMVRIGSAIFKNQ